MKLLIDLGNSRFKWAFAKGENSNQWQTGSEAISGGGFDVMLNTLWSDVSVPDKVMMSSVISEKYTQQIVSWIQSRWQLSPYLAVSAAEQLGVINCYAKPETLGSDRWAALIGARALSKKPTVIVDCGSAVTIDALAADGRFIGGIIFPGLNLLRQSLAAGTKNISQVSGETNVDTNVDMVPACNTADAVSAGTLHGLVGAIEHMLTHYRHELGKTMDIILTGGNAEVIRPRLSVKTRHEADLVLKGLALMADTVE